MKTINMRKIDFQSLSQRVRDAMVADVLNRVKRIHFVSGHQKKWEDRMKRRRAKEKQNDNQ